MAADQAAQLGRQREHHVEAGHRQEQVVLVGEPALGGVVAAAGAGAVPARVVEHVPVMTPHAHPQVAPEGGRAATRDGGKRAHVARQHHSAMTLHVGRPVAPHDVGEPDHVA